jgi:cytochrome c553
VTRRLGARAVLLAALALASPARAASLEERAAACLACHGPKGQSAIPLTPSIGGQPSFFVVAQLFLYRRGGRADPVMSAVAQSMTDDDLRAFGEWASKLPPPAPPAQSADPQRAARAMRLLQRHPCAACHNADFSGRDQIPRLAHQREDYLLKVMREYRGGSRVGYGGAMAQELVGLTDADLEDLAHLLAHFPSAR